MATDWFLLFCYWFLKSITWCILGMLDSLLRKYIHQDFLLRSQCWCRPLSTMKQKVMSTFMLLFLFSFTFSINCSYASVRSETLCSVAFCRSVILMLVATQMPKLSQGGSCLMLSEAEYFRNPSESIWLVHLSSGCDAFREAAWTRLLSPRLVVWLLQALGIHVPAESSEKHECCQKFSHLLWNHVQYLYCYLTFFFFC